MSPGRRGPSARAGCCARRSRPVRSPCSQSSCSHFWVSFSTRAGKRQAPPKDALVVTQTQDFASLDPALAQTQEAWELEYAKWAKLRNYPATGGYRGTRLVPEV